MQNREFSTVSRETVARLRPGRTPNELFDWPLAPALSAAPDEFPLRDAPDRFFDLDRWHEFIAFFSNREAALAQISRREPGILVYYRQEVAKLPTSEGENARERQRIADLGNILVSEFISRFAGSEKEQGGTV